MNKNNYSERKIQQRDWNKTRLIKYSAKTNPFIKWFEHCKNKVLKYSVSDYSYRTFNLIFLLGGRYLGSSVSSTEKDIDTRLTKAWTAIDRHSIIWKSDLTDKMKRSFFQAAVMSILLYGCTTWTLTKRLEKKPDGNYTRILRAILNKYFLEKQRRAHNGPPHMTKPKQDNQLEHTSSSYVRIRDVALKTRQRRWTIGRSGERGSGKSMLAAQHDDDDDDDDDDD